jgi:hypothetical protein
MLPPLRSGVAHLSRPSRVLQFQDRCERGEVGDPFGDSLDDHRLTGLLVVTTQRGSAARFRVLRDRPELLNQNDSACHNPHTGITCGRPSGHVVASQ